MRFIQQYRALLLLSGNRIHAFSLSHICCKKSVFFTRALRKKSQGRFDTCLEPLGSQLKLKIGRGLHGTYILHIPTYLVGVGVLHVCKVVN